jgi:formate dehydrogenase major subunit
MFGLPLSTRPQPSREPFSQQTLAKTSRLRGASVTESVCPYCAVGCGQLICTKAGKVIDIEGNPESPINEGTLCPKGADAFQLAVNPHRLIHVLYRCPLFRPLGAQTAGMGDGANRPARQGSPRRRLHRDR